MHKLFAPDVTEIKRQIDNGAGYRVLMERYHQPWAVIHAIATGAIPQPAAAAAHTEDSPCSH